MSLQSHWAGAVPHTTANAASAPSDEHTSTVPPVAINTQAVAPVKCNWTEHTSPDGYKYYYNSVTGESKVSFFEDSNFMKLCSDFCG